MITRFVLPTLQVVLLLTSFVPVKAETVPDTCYLPNGGNASDHKPCYSTTGDGHSHCCNPVYEICLDNGLCFAQGAAVNPGQLYRDSCTDKTWNAASCPSVCRKTYTNSACPLVGILTPPDNGGQTQSWCCLAVNLTDGSCYGEDATFTPGKVVANWGPLESASASGTASSSSASATSTTSASSTSSSAAATTTSSKSNADIASEHDAAIGAGVGVPLGLLLVASLAGLFFQHRRHKQQLAQWQNASVAGTAGGMQYPLQDPKTTYQHAPGYQDSPMHGNQGPQHSYELPNVERGEMAA